MYSNIEIPVQLLIAIAVVIIVLITWLINRLEKFKKNSHKFEVTSTKLEGDLKEKILIIDKIHTDTKGFAQDLAIKQF